MSARHYRQPRPWGCMYYSFAALTGVELFEHVEDCSMQRFAVRAAEAGYMLWPLYRDEFAFVDGGPYAPARLWERLATSPMLESEEHAWWLLLGIPSIKHGGACGHTVAVLLHRRGAVVYDPGCEHEEEMGLEEFVASPYARAFEVFNLQPHELDAYPVVHGPSQPHALAVASEGDR